MSASRRGSGEMGSPRPFTETLSTTCAASVTSDIVHIVYAHALTSANGAVNGHTGKETHASADPRGLKMRLQGALIIAFPKL